MNHSYIIIISIFVTVIIMVYINMKYKGINLQSTSCGHKEPTCSTMFDLENTGLPEHTALCVNQTKCSHVKPKELDIDFDGSTFELQFRVPKIGCTELGDMEICCTGDLLQCFAAQIALKDFRISTGYSIPFNSKICSLLPSCFIENDSTPYLLFPIPDFSIKVYNDSSLVDPGFKHDKLNKNIATAFGTLGAMPMSMRQASVYIIKLPKYVDIVYFSIMPYLFQVGSDVFIDKFEEDLSFASMTDSFNLHNLENMKVDGDKIDMWMNNGGDLTVIFIASHNKKMTENIYAKLKVAIDQIDGTPLGDIPIINIPLPAGSSYGNVVDPLGRDMLKETRTNKNVVDKTPLYNWETDTIGIVGRIASKTGRQGELDEWLDDLADQKRIVVLGLEDDTPDWNQDDNYEAFKLHHQNGRFNNDGLWEGGFVIDNLNFNEDSWKIQEPYDTGNLDLAQLGSKASDIATQMKEFGYDQYIDIPINSHPSPFPHYNRFVSSKGYDNSKLTWSQSGLDMIQYNVSAYGDCRDTQYPTSDTFCLGKYDVVVILSNNFAYVNNDILYNNLNVYDSESQTSLASYRGDEDEAKDKTVYSLAVSRTDFGGCVGNLPSSINNTQFLPSGPHINLGASSTTTFFVQSRCYVHIPTGTSSIMTIDQSRFIVRVFSPCKGSEKIYPSICYDYEDETCSENTKTADCPNDRTVEWDDKNTRSDNISATICGGLRLEKTTEKTQLISMQVLFGSFLIIGIMTILSVSIYNNEKDIQSVINGIGVGFKPYITPLLGCLVVTIFITIKLNYVTKTTAYNLNQTKKQR
jgi:hypothetical protein